MIAITDRVGLTLAYVFNLVDDIEIGIAKEHLIYDKGISEDKLLSVIDMDEYQRSDIHEIVKEQKERHWSLWDYKCGQYLKDLIEYGYYTYNACTLASYHYPDEVVQDCFDIYYSTEK